MKVFLFSVVIISIVALSRAGIKVEKLEPHPEYPGKCFFSESVILSPGDVVKDHRRNCGEIACTEPNLAISKTCSAMAGRKGYAYGDFVDLTREFPACCEKHVIKLEN